MPSRCRATLLPSGSVYALLAGHRRHLIPRRCSPIRLSRHGAARVCWPTWSPLCSYSSPGGLLRSGRRSGADPTISDRRPHAACPSGRRQSPAGARLLAASTPRLTLPNRILDTVRPVVAATGALGRQIGRSLHSTVLDDAVPGQRIPRRVDSPSRLREDLTSCQEIIDEVR
jgi:hypothetical protein